ncbi:MAG: TolB family protein [Solirubrobacteraceae bacterium]
MTSAPRRRRALTATATAGAVCASTLAWLPTAGVDATNLPVRTFDLAALTSDRGAFSGAAGDPAISASGLLVAFDSPASTAQQTAYGLAPGTREVYSVNVLTGSRTLVSATPSGTPASGKSTAPSVSGDGSVVAFVSTSSALAAGASASFANVYVRLAGGRVVLASGGQHGAAADGTAGEPAISADGRFVAFTSTATNLTGGTGKHLQNVFIRDLRAGRTVLVSVGRKGAVANSWSSNPSISGTGRYVSFDSAASNPPASRRTHVPQVYVRDTIAGRTSIVSVTSGGIPQNQAVAPAFRQVSSISADGRLVAFDSNANNLVRGDVNRRSDVFVRNLRRHTTVLVSVNNAGYEGNSDSFTPAFSADGTKVAFESFATNLASGGGPVENVFIRDLALGTTSVIDVGPAGQPPSRERVTELLQRPALSANGVEAVFESTAANLTGDSSPSPHVFLRLMNAPVAFFASRPPTSIGGGVLRLGLGTDDPTADKFLCQVDEHPRFQCGGVARFSGLRRGHHVIRIRAGGAGMLYQSAPLVATVTVR